MAAKEIRIDAAVVAFFFFYQNWGAFLYYREVFLVANMIFFLLLTGFGNTLVHRSSPHGGDA